MTGQVDEAGREAELRRLVPATFEASFEVPVALDALSWLLEEVAGLRTQLEAERQESARWRTLWDTHGKNDLLADRDRLAGQVAAIRAIPWATFNPDNEAEIHHADGYNEALSVVRAALAASLMARADSEMQQLAATIQRLRDDAGPTTPEATE